MNITRVLMKCNSFQNRAPIALRSANASRLFTPRTNNALQKRLLMSSIETGGIAPFRQGKRIGIHLKIPAAILLVGSLAEWYWVTVNEDTINEFLGTNWNTSLVFGMFECIIGPMLAYVVFCATLPF